MLFSDITDCEMLVFRCIQEAKEPISLVQIMEVLEEKYQRDWKRSTVCTFISHLIEKGYVVGRREGRTFYYSSAINNRKFRE
jgi:predicted transcriptional regulator